MPTTPVPPGEPEYLGDATPSSVTGSPRRRGPGRVAALGLAAAGVAGVVALGGWTALSLMASGTQPASALPADTVAYLSIDLDPSAGQKLEAVRMLEKFPALDEKLGLDATDDLRRWAFDRSALARCAGVDYDEDVAPWIGDRAAVAVVPAATGTKQADGPEVVMALQVTSEEKATTALAELADCKVADGPRKHEPGFAAGDGYVVIAETAAVAEAAVERAADASLADDAMFQRWTGEAGDAGIATSYLSPEAPGELAGLARELETHRPWSGYGTPGGADEHPLLSGGEVGHSFGLGGPLDGPLGSGLGGPGIAGRIAEDFEGAAAVLRFADETLELEVAGGGLPEGTAPAQGGTDVTELPSTTGAAASWAFEDGWFSTALDSFTELSGGLPLDPMFRLVEARTGLSLPEDAETLLGDSLAVAVDSSLEVAAIEDEDPSQLPAGVRVSGDPDEILAVVEKVRARLGSRTDEIVVESGDGVVALGFDQTYVEGLVAAGGLGDEPVFQDAVPQADRAGGVLFVDFGAGDGWVERLVADYGQALEGRSPADVTANLRPLEALGISTWTDDGVQRGLLRLTTR